MASTNFQVGNWLAELSRNTVSLHGAEVRLEPKVMEVLACLAEHARETVSKETLLQAVWPGIFVGDEVLTRSISELRRVLGDDAHELRFIQTIPKRGYRLVAPGVRVNGTRTPVSSARPAQQDRTDEIWGGRLRGNAWALVGAVLLLGALVTLNAAGVRARLLGDGAPQVHSLAVLPLQNLSGDSGQEYFADGMTEELITELSHIHALRVISRTSVMRYKKTDKSLPQIARELNVDAIVEGSVLRAGDRVRITAQLIFARTDANLWAETYDRNLQDTLGVQEAVATAIAGKIKANMIPSAVLRSKTPRPVNFKAHEAFLRGIEQASLQGAVSNHVGMEAAAEQHYRRSLAYYQEALREDPNYAPVYVAMASSAETPEIAEASARKALEIDDAVSDAHLILGAIKLVRDRNWQDAEKEYLRAIELNPSSARAHDGYGVFPDTAGRLDEAMAEFQRAQELDPAGDHLVGAFYSRREFDKVIASARADLADSPESTSGAAGCHKRLMVAYARTGRQKESIEQFRAGLASMGYVDLAEDLRRGYAHGGYDRALREWLKGLKRHPKFPFPWLETYAYTELRDYDEAFARLPKLYDPMDWGNVAYSDTIGVNSGDVRVFPTLVTLRIDPMWDPLHPDPRFELLVRQLGFPQ